MIFVEIIGWAGMVLLLLTFFLASNRRLNENRYLYHYLNFAGALGVLINAANKGVWAVVSMEAAWAFIAIIGIINVFRHERRTA